MRTPLGKVRGLGSAKKGTEHFWLQRLTAIANVPLFIFFIVFIIAYSGASYEAVTEAFSNPIISAFFALMVLSGLVHMRLGMQVIIEDYIHAEGAKLALLVLNTFFTLLMGALLIFAIFKLGFGG